MKHDNFERKKAVKSPPVNPEEKVLKFGSLYVWSDTKNRRWCGYLVDNHPAHNSPADSFPEATIVEGGAK